MNSVKLPCSPRLLITQWIEHQSSVMGSIPVRDSEFFLLPCLCRVHKFIFHISLLSLKFTIFFHLVNYLLNTQGQENQALGSWEVCSISLFKVFEETKGEYFSYRQTNDEYEKPSTNLHQCMAESPHDI